MASYVVMSGQSSYRMVRARGWKSDPAQPWRSPWLTVGDGFDLKLSSSEYTDLEEATRDAEAEAAKGGKLPVYVVALPVQINPVSNCYDPAITTVFTAPAKG